MERCRASPAVHRTVDRKRAGIVSQRDQRWLPTHGPFARIDKNARDKVATTEAQGRKDVYLATQLCDELHERHRRGRGASAAVALVRRTMLGRDENLWTQRHVLATAPGAAGTQQPGGNHRARSVAASRTPCRRRAPRRLVRPERLRAHDSGRRMYLGLGPDRLG